MPSKTGVPLLPQDGAAVIAIPDSEAVRSSLIADLLKLRRSACIEVAADHQSNGAGGGSEDRTNHALNTNGGNSNNNSSSYIYVLSTSEENGVDLLQLEFAGLCLYYSSGSCFKPVLEMGLKAIEEKLEYILADSEPDWYDGNNIATI